MHVIQNDLQLATLLVSVGRAVDQDPDPTREEEADVTLVLIHLVIAVISVMIVDVHQIVEDAVRAVTVLIVVRTVIGIGITDAIKTAMMTAMTDAKIERAMISGVKLARMRTVALSVAALPAVLLINTVAEPHLLMEREEDLLPVIQIGSLYLINAPTALQVKVLIPRKEHLRMTSGKLHSSRIVRKLGLHEMMALQKLMLKKSE